MPADYYPVLIGLGLAFVLGAVLLLLSWLLGDKTGGKVKLSPYESGEPLLDHSRKRISVLFFLIAIDFVVFDVEAAFLFPWVLVLRQGGWPLFWAVMAFIGLVVLGLVYIWKKGGLDIQPRYAPAHPGVRDQGSGIRGEA
ncbi:MAG: NADH-quinone oxidoreductase subunit A [Thermoanaerobaculia bacterium]